MAGTTQPRKVGLLGGLVLLSLGTLLLLRNFGFIDNFWSVVARYWPLLLILMGLAKILEYTRGTSGRMLRFGEFVLILFVVLFGWVASKLPVQVRFPFGDRRVSVSDYYGNSFTFTEEKTQAVGANPFLTIKNSQGDVTLVPGIEGQLQVKLRKVVYARSEHQARETAKQIELVVAPEGAGWRIETNRPQLGPRESRFETSFEISVPPSVTTEISNNNGDLSLEGLTGNQTVATSYGRLSLSRLRGGINGTNKYGETRISAVTGNVQLACLHGKAWVENISGDLALTNSYAPVEVSDIHGKTAITNSYSTVTANNLKQGAEINAPGSKISVDGIEGELKIRSSHKEVTVENSTTRVELEQEYGSIRAINIGGDLVIRASYAGVSGSRIKGSVRIEGSNAEIDLEEVRGDTDIRNKYKPVTLVDFGGKVDVINENGAVTLVSSSPLKQPITADTTYGNLELSLPADCAFQLDARTRAGDLDSEFTGPQAGKESGDVRYLRGQVGANGPMVKLQTNYSNISIKKSSRSR